MPGAWAVTSPQAGTSGDLCVSPLALGTFAVLSLMTGSAVERLVPEPLSGNLSGIEREQLDAQRVGAAAAVAFGSGALMVREDGKGGGGGKDWGSPRWAGGVAGGEGGTSVQRRSRQKRCTEKPAALCRGWSALLLW